MRIDKFITEVKALISRSHVNVNGSPIKSADTLIDPSDDRITVNGREIAYRQYMYIMLNEPADIVCDTRDGLGSTVLGLLPPHLHRKELFPAGRFDKDTEGFAFITDDNGDNIIGKDGAVVLYRLYRSCLNLYPIPYRNLYYSENSVTDYTYLTTAN